MAKGIETSVEFKWYIETASTRSKHRNEFIEWSSDTDRRIVDTAFRVTISNQASDINGTEDNVKYVQRDLNLYYAESATLNMACGLNARCIRTSFNVI